MARLGEPYVPPPDNGGDDDDGDDTGGEVTPGPPEPAPAPSVRCSNLIAGSLVSDILRGTRRSDSIVGDAGDDQLFGFGGIDCLYGSPGRDLLSGGRGDDNLFGGRGADELRGGSGKDDLNGGPGNDVIAAGPGQDAVGGGQRQRPHRRARRRLGSRGLRVSGTGHRVHRPRRRHARLRAGERQALTAPEGAVVPARTLASVAEEELTFREGSVADLETTFALSERAMHDSAVKQGVIPPGVALTRRAHPRGLGPAALDHRVHRLAARPLRDRRERRRGRWATRARCASRAWRS